MITFQEILRKLTLFWEKEGCVIHQGYDLEVGAGTFNPATFLRSLGPEPYKAAYIEPSRRPADGRFGENPNRLQHYFQYQVILKPSPANIQDLYLQSLESIGFKLNEHDIRFVHDDWESPTLGAWGLGWEVWMDGMEVTQFTYFQSLGGIPLKPVTGEITYGIERLAMYLQKVNSIFDIQWSNELTYRDIYHRNEVEWSHYNFDQASIEMWHRHFEDYEKEAGRLMAANYPLPAYDFVMKASHAFNLLDARGAISVTERTGYIARIRDLSKQIAESYVKSREEQKFPLLNRFQSHETKPKIVEAIFHDDLLEADPSKHEDFLLEIGSEELPATFVPIGCINLEKGIRQLLKDEDISFTSLKTYGTPRRLAVYIQNLSMGKPAKTIEKRGPSIENSFNADGSPKPAAEGFFRSLNKKSLSLNEIRANVDHSISIQNVKGVDYLFANITTPGASTAKILAEHLSSIILGIEFPKKMRWGNLDISYARPLRWIVALFGKHVIPFTIANLTSGRTSWGHRQLRPFDFALLKAQDYLPILKEHRVLVDMEEREKTIHNQLDELEKTLGAQIICRDRVIPQVLNLSEWPQVTSARFDQSFLKAPKEVLISEMVEHQKYFPVADAQGNLLNLFVITADNTPTESIHRGNQKVLSARLSDGVFLYEQGLRFPLEKFNEKLKNVTFQKGLGSMYDKVQRLIKHIETLNNHLKLADLNLAKRAALLSKADLATEMVYEFPELQGVVGRYYALAGKENPEVAQAIDEQWMPRGENAPLPQTGIGILLSLSDKIDNLLSCYIVGLKPTSSSDPYALRRQTLGIIKMLIEKESHISIKELFRECLKNFPENLQKDKESLLSEIESFFTNRIKTVFLDFGFGKEEIEASLSGGFDDVYDAFCKVKALREFRTSNDKFPLLFEVYKRAKGQIQQQKTLPFSSELLLEEAEKKLDQRLNETQVAFEQAISQHDYQTAYQLIASLQPAIATLFDQVKILADDAAIKNNRIALLQRVFGFFSKLLDFSKIQES